MTGDRRRRRPLAIDEGLSPSPVSISRHLRDHVIERADIQMVHLVAETSGCAVDFEVRVDAPVRIARVFPVEEPRHAIALKSTETNLFAEHEVASANRVSPELQLAAHDVENLALQSRSHTLVGIDIEDPVVPGTIDRVVLL